MRPRKSTALSTTATKSWPKERSAGFRSGWTRIYTHYFTGEVDKGLEYARQ